MKKNYIILFMFALLALFITGCNNNKFYKTEYKINEIAIIDDFKLGLIKVVRMENDVLELNFKITNNGTNTTTLNPDGNFVFYDKNKVQVPNMYSNNSNIIKKDQTINYTLQYNVSTKELYEIYFYSGIVENNIKFSFNNSDILIEE